MPYDRYEKKEKAAAYRTRISPEVIDAIYENTLHKMIVEKKYRDCKYNAQQLARDIQTNTRYISAAISLRFHMSFSELINGYRVRDAMSMLTDRRCRHMSIAQIAEACGFSSRQALHAAFYKAQHQTPRAYQQEFFQKIEAGKRKEPKGQNAT